MRERETEEREREEEKLLAYAFQTLEDNLSARRLLVLAVHSLLADDVPSLLVAGDGDVPSLETGSNAQSKYI